MAKDKKNIASDKSENIKRYITEHKQLFSDTPCQPQTKLPEKPFYEQNNDFYYSIKTVSCELH